MSLQKAEIAEKDNPGSKITCAFNPASITVSTGATWHETPARGAPSAPSTEFVSTNPRQMTMELQFADLLDEAATKVKDAVPQLMKWTNPKQGSNPPNPPLLIFQWGQNQDLRFPVYLQTVSAKYDHFNPQGVPVRAVVNVTFKEHPDPPSGTNPTSGGVPGRRTHVLAAGDTLHSIAYQEYGNPSLWRGLAEANAIDDPMRVPVGTTVLIPPADDVEDLS